MVFFFCLLCFFSFGCGLFVWLFFPQFTLSICLCTSSWVVSYIPFFRGQLFSLLAYLVENKEKVNSHLFFFLHLEKYLFSYNYNSNCLTGICSKLKNIFGWRLKMENYIFRDVLFFKLLVCENCFGTLIAATYFLQNKLCNKPWLVLIYNQKSPHWQ